MAKGKFYANWQSVLAAKEDAVTALSFGFLRHVAPHACLTPWLKEVLDADQLAVEPLTLDAFWPDYDSVIDGSVRTQPELVFEVRDPDPLVVVVENKISDGAHTLPQTYREVVDVAHKLRKPRMAMIMIGTDSFVPYDLDKWSGTVADKLAEHALGFVQARLLYTSWASVHRHILAARTHPEVPGAYAQDVAQQLSRGGFAGYEGVPMLEDLDMNLTNAVIAYNRIVAAVRHLFRKLTEHPDFQAMGLAARGQGFEMRTDAYSKKLNQAQDTFLVSTFGITARHARWPPGASAFVAVRFPADKSPELAAGASWIGWGDEDATYWFAKAAPVEAAPPIPAQLRQPSKQLPCLQGAEGTAFRYASRPWQDAGDDMQWVLNRLHDTHEVWVNDPARSRLREKAKLANAAKQPGPA